MSRANPYESRKVACAHPGGDDAIRPWADGALMRAPTAQTNPSTSLAIENLHDVFTQMERLTVAWRIAVVADERDAAVLGAETGPA